MRVINPREYLSFNEEVDAIHLLEEDEYQILLSYKKLYLTRVKITEQELEDMIEEGLLSPFPKFAPTEEGISIYGSIIVPSGSMEEAHEIIGERQFNEQVLGVLTQLGTPFKPLNMN